MGLKLRVNDKSQVFDLVRVSGGLTSMKTKKNERKLWGKEPKERQLI